MTLEFALEFITGNVRLAEDSIIRNLVQHGETSKTVQAAIEEFNWLVSSIEGFCGEVRMRRGPPPSFEADHLAAVIRAIRSFAQSIVATTIESPEIKPSCVCTSEVD